MEKYVKNLIIENKDILIESINIDILSSDEIISKLNRIEDKNQLTYNIFKSIELFNDLKISCHLCNRAMGIFTLLLNGNPTCLFCPIFHIDICCRFENSIYTKIGLDQTIKGKIDGIERFKVLLNRSIDWLNHLN